MNTHPMKISISLATDSDRESIYAIRHQVYARELSQHRENEQSRLSDALDEVNAYFVAKIAGEIAGFVSVTPPSEKGYSIDKYFAREDLPLVFDQGLYEVRLLTVCKAHRGAHISTLLMYAALRHVEALGGRTLAAIGRLEVLPMYEKVGLKSLGRRAQSGEVGFELLCAEVRDLRRLAESTPGMLEGLERMADWRMAMGFHKKDACYHGGAFFEAIGEEFDDLSRKDSIINADVLDAWFDPAPGVLEKLAEQLPFALRTSPPTGCEGMQKVIARARGVMADHILPGAGSSDLIFAGLRHWVKPSSKVLILDPMYGEYAHVLEKVIGAKVDRLTLSKDKGWRVDLAELAAWLRRGYDWVVMVNPNSPTGQHISRVDLEDLLYAAPKTTRFWVDETYVEYAGPAQSLEQYAAYSTNVVVCKSMSKVYALSGARCAYLCGPPWLMDELRPFSPPWAVSLPGQIAAVEALKSTAYYREKWGETHELRSELRFGLLSLGWEVPDTCASFLLCHLPATAPEAARLVEAAHKRGLYVRDVKNMGRCFDQRTLRIAVKDRKTNYAMIEILKLTLAELRGEARMKAAA